MAEYKKTSCSVRRALILELWIFSDVPNNPVEINQEWIKDAFGKANKPNALVLSTVNNGKTDSRSGVWLPDFDENGLTFFTIQFKTRK